MNTRTISRLARSGFASVHLSALLVCADAALARQCGEGWAQLAIQGPPVVAGSTMVYDSAREVVVLAGGSNGSTWVYDGKAWTQVGAPGTGPTSGHMAFDPERAVVVLYSGLATRHEQTWEWNGTAWALKQSGTQSGYEGSAMAYFPLTHQMIRWGGRYATGCGGGTCPPYLYSTTFLAWTGTDWSALGSAGDGYTSHALAYDPTGARLLRDGGFYTVTSPIQNFDLHTRGWTGPGNGWNIVVHGGFDPNPAESNPLVSLYYDSVRNEMRRARGGISRLINGNQWETVTDDRPVGLLSGSPIKQIVWDGGRQRLMALLLSTGPNSQVWVWDGLPTPPRLQPTTYGPARATLGGQMNVVFGVYDANNLTYQWHKNGAPVSLGGHIIRADNWLIIQPFACEDVGVYHCVVSNACGTVVSGEWASDTAWISSVSPPYGPRQTQFNSTATLRVTAANPNNVTYQWRFRGVPLVNGGNITGATTNELRIQFPTCEQYHGDFDVVVTSACGQSRTSGAWSIAPFVPFASVSRAPATNPVRAGQLISLTGNVTQPDPGPYSWTWSRNGQPVVDGPNVTGATTANLRVLSATLADAGIYQAFMTSQCTGIMGESAVVTIDVWCRGDTNNDRLINFADLNMVLSQFGQFGALPGDVTGNMLVNFDDLNIVLSEFGGGC